MDVKLYNFSKRENSTKRPSGGTSVPVVLKDGTSIYNPSFELISSTAPDSTYLSWAGRYYYIDDITYLNGRYIIACSIDVLATWKDEIGATSAFIKYASSGYDIGLVDGRLSSDLNAIVKRRKKDILAGFPSGYIVTYVGEQGTTNPVVALSETGVCRLMTSIQDSAFAEILNNPDNALSKILSDCASAITSCKYLPIVATAGTREIVLAGGYNTGVTGSEVEILTGNNIFLDIPWNFPKGDFRNRSQFTSIIIYLPSYGYAQLNTDDLIGKDTLDVTAVLDSTSGGIAYDVGGIFKAECDISTPIQISTTTQGNALGALVSAGGALAGALSGNVAVAGAGLFGAFTSAMQTNTGSLGSMGSHAGWSLHANDVELIVISHNTNVEPSNMASQQGRPVGKVAGIVSGYNECVNASVNCNAPQVLKDRINAYMNGGFYYE